MRHCGRSRRSDDGFTLIEILIAIVLVGVLSAVAVVGISNLVSKGAKAACTASADAARAAAAVYLTSHAAYPPDLVAMTTAAGAGATLIPAALTLPSGVTVTGVVATSAGGHWTLTMTPGSVGVAPTFVCASTAVTATITPVATTTAPATSVPAVVCPRRFLALRRGWRGEYFGTVDLSGPPVLCRNDEAIDFDWAAGAPLDGLPEDAFSVRWTRTEKLAEGDHTFTLAADDGSRLFIDGELVLDRWDPEKARETSPTVTVALAGGKHELVVEYYERDGPAHVSLRSAVGGGIGQECPIDAVGWLGEYFADGDLAGRPTLCRDDAAIDFDWADGAPLEGLPKDGFAVRWTRTETLAKGDHTYTLAADDGSRLFIDGELVLDRWDPEEARETSPTVTVALGGGKHELVVEYSERDDLASVSLRSSRDGGGFGQECPMDAVGWLGEYFADGDLTGRPTLCRDDVSVDFDWAAGAPLEGLPKDEFAVRWTTTQAFDEGAYTFTLGSDDGGRLFVDGKLVIDAWFDQLYPEKPPSVTMDLGGGPHTVVVEYYDARGPARVALTITPPT